MTKGGAGTGANNRRMRKGNACAPWDKGGDWHMIREGMLEEGLIAFTT
ncbi:hypothetical protein SAMN05216312_103365 [Cohnella sp. OV330]|nr:hypothetical protein SAMN05216312_103365 [Cohnella sp. OV330]